MQSKIPIHQRKELVITIISLSGILLHLLLFFIPQSNESLIIPIPFLPYSYLLKDLPLLIALFFGGLPLVFDLSRHIFAREFNADILAGISIVTAILLQEYLAGTIVILMLSGGQVLERFAVSRASSAIDAFSRRLPDIAYVKSKGGIKEVSVDTLTPGEIIIIKGNTISPVDGTVVQGSGSMDESLLSGEPYFVAKTTGSTVIAGALNGNAILEIKVEKVGENTRYKKIMSVMEESQQRKPKIRRLADELGAYYTPVALLIAITAWALSGDPIRFLSVLVVATPCPLLIAIPVAIIGSISLAARHGILIKDPSILERISSVKKIYLDKTGTMTYGKPEVTEVESISNYSESEILQLAGSLEQFSDHPLSSSIIQETKRKNLPFLQATMVEEVPGTGLKGLINNEEIIVSSRKFVQLTIKDSSLPAHKGGLECILLSNMKPIGIIRLRDTPREQGKSFISHLKKSHTIDQVVLLSGDDASEVEYLANLVGIQEIYSRKSPEEKLAIIEQSSSRAPTLFVGDGINDAPALSAATIGVAFGSNSDISSEAAGAVIMDSSLEKLDELFHIGIRMKKIALQSAAGGMGLSIIAMCFASLGYLPPVAGAITQEIIDIFAVANALRTSYEPQSLSDLE
jgi:heavy metal translocating P-type ATPase